MQARKPLIAAATLLFPILAFSLSQSTAEELASAHVSGAETNVSSAGTEDADFPAIGTFDQREVGGKTLGSNGFTSPKPVLGAIPGFNDRSDRNADALHGSLNRQSLPQRKPLQSPLRIENGPGLMMTSLTAEELKKLGYPARPLAFNPSLHLGAPEATNPRRHGTMMASLSQEALAKAHISGAGQKTLLSSLETNRLGSYSQNSDSVRAQAYHHKGSEGSGEKTGAQPEGSGTSSSHSSGYAHEGGYRGHHGKGGHGEYAHGDSSPFGHVLRLEKQLGLTADQVKQIKDAKFDFEKVRIRAEAEHQIAHMELDRLVHSGTVDESRIRQLADLIAETKSKKIHAMAEAKIAILKILTPDQRQKVSEMHSPH